MRSPDLYTKAILTIIAGLLAWDSRLYVSRVHAQSPASQYASEMLIWPTDLGAKNWGDKPTLEIAISRAAKGRELVTLLVPPGEGHIVAVFKERK